MNSKLSELYYDPHTGFTGARQLWINANKKYTLKKVTEWLSNQEGQQIIAASIKSARKYHTIVATGPREYQMDLTFYRQYKRQNNGYIGLFTAINITTRYGYAIPIKSKSLAQVSSAISIFMTKARPRVVTSDNEASFIRIMNNKYLHVKHYTIDPGNKTTTGMIERFNRTIREKITKYMTAFRTKKWIDALPKLVLNYNQSVHRSIGLAPKNVTKAQETIIIQKAKKDGASAIEAFEDFAVGDSVRLLKEKKQFAKGSATFSRGIYTIVGKSGLHFILNNPKGKLLLTRYKHWQLRKINKELLSVAPRNASTTQHSTKKVRSSNRFRTLQMREGTTNDAGVININHRLKPKSKKRRVRKPVRMNI